MLHIRSVGLASFATHDKTTIAFPAKGLVTVVGANGAGKSSALEAIAAALWNESLRGEMGWREGQAGAVRVETDGLIATRKRSKAGATKLEWNAKGEEAVAYETTGKAQIALESVIGSYDVWRRTCVLSSVDSAAFSLARDAERKRLLEEFLGLGMFDVALDACRKDKKEVSARLQKAELSLAEASAKHSFLQTQLQQAQKEWAALPEGTHDLAALKAEGQEVAARVQLKDKELQEARRQRDVVQRQRAEVSAAINAEKARLAKLGADTCVTCGQNVVDMRCHLEREITRMKAEAITKMADLDTQLLVLDETVEIKAEAIRLLQEDLSILREKYKVAEYAAKHRAGLAQKVLDAQNALAEYGTNLDGLKQAKEAAAGEVACLEAVEQVLGLRGVRAQVLDHSLKALEQQANAWLVRMPTEQGVLAISLSGSTTQKSGSVVDAISLKVRGRPYASCSGGERRRVDVALLLALRELAVAAHGRDGSLLCDEVFDALDQQGQADVAAALADMAQDRMVLVVTHSPGLVRELRPIMQLQVSIVDGHAEVTSL